MAYQDQTQKMQKTLFTIGDGVNKEKPAYYIEDSECSYMENMDSRSYPALTVRPDRTFYADVGSTAIEGLGCRNNQYINAVAGNTWKYYDPSTGWVNLTTTLSHASTVPVTVDDFVTGTARYTVLMNSTQKLYHDGTSTCLAISDTNCPAASKFAIHKGRIFVITGAQINYCALNKITDWTTSNDAGSISVTNAKGDLTAICEYKDKIIVWSAYSMHELYGSGPDTFELVSVESDNGCLNQYSLTKCNGRLYWAGYNGIFEYDGSTIQKISDPIALGTISESDTKKYVLGGQDIYLYVTFYNRGANDNTITYKFDTKLRKWYIDDLGFLRFTTLGGFLYGFNHTYGTLQKVRSTSYTGQDTYNATTSVKNNAWEVRTKMFTDMVVAENKTLNDIYVNMDSTGVVTFQHAQNTATLNPTTHTNPTLSQYQTFNTADSAPGGIATLRVMPNSTELQDVGWYMLRIKGTGMATIYNLQKNYRVNPR